MSTDIKRTELPIGTIVHHRGTKSTLDSNDSEHAAGWGRVVERKDPYPDNTRDYRVQLCAPDPGETREHWWISYNIDNWVLPKEAPTPTAQ